MARRDRDGWGRRGNSPIICRCNQRQVTAISPPVCGMHLTLKKHVINSGYPRWHLILLAFIFRRGERFVLEELCLLVQGTKCDERKQRLHRSPERVREERPSRVCRSHGGREGAVAPVFSAINTHPTRKREEKRFFQMVRAKQRGESPVFWVVTQSIVCLCKRPEASAQSLCPSLPSRSMLWCFTWRCLLPSLRKISKTKSVRLVPSRSTPCCIYTCGSIFGASCLLRLFMGPGNTTGVWSSSPRSQHAPSSQCPAREMGAVMGPAPSAKGNLSLQGNPSGCCSWENKKASALFEINFMH